MSDIVLAAGDNVLNVLMTPILQLIYASDIRYTERFEDKKQIMNWEVDIKNIGVAPVTDRPVAFIETVGAPFGVAMNEATIQAGQTVTFYGQFTWTYTEVAIARLVRIESKAGIISFELGPEPIRLLSHDIPLTLAIGDTIQPICTFLLPYRARTFYWPTLKAGGKSLYSTIISTPEWTFRRTAILEPGVSIYTAKSYLAYTIQDIALGKYDITGSIMIADIIDPSENEYRPVETVNLGKVGEVVIVVGIEVAVDLPKEVWWGTTVSVPVHVRNNYATTVTRTIAFRYEISGYPGYSEQKQTITLAPGELKTLYFDFWAEPRFMNSGVSVSVDGVVFFRGEVAIVGEGRGLE